MAASVRPPNCQKLNNIAGDGPMMRGEVPNEQELEIYEP